MILYNSSPMKVLGIITEYNPLHKGHLYHIEASKNATQSDVVVAVMSGHFVQRGEPAICNKWVRAEWALKSGVDLVIELPTVYATASAEAFSYGAVALLEALGSVDTLCFGSESGDISTLLEQAQWQAQNAETLKDQAIASPSLSFSQHRDALSGQTLNTSNDILGVSYLLALQKLNAKIEPATIQRIQNQYKDQSIQSEIASATAIRRALISDHYGHKELNDTALSVRETLAPATAAYFETHDPFEYDVHRLDLVLLGALRRATLEELDAIHDVPAGLSYRLKRAAAECETMADLVAKVQTKHLTRGRIQRILIKHLLNIQQADLLPDCQTSPEYIRVLGFTEKGKQVLRQCQPTLPLITNLGKSGILEGPEASGQMAIDVRATALYALLSRDSSLKATDDFKRPPLRV